MRLRTAILSLIPRAAHVDLGRAKRGQMLFILFALSAHGALVAPFLTGVEGVRTGCALAAAGVWVAALYDALRTAAWVKKRTSSPSDPAGQAGGALDVPSERPVGGRSA